METLGYGGFGMIDPGKVYEQAMEAAEDYADKDHAAGVLEDALDALKGTLTADLKSKGESVTIISSLVKKDHAWIELSVQWRDARKSAILAKLKYDQVCRWQDNIRTNAVTDRSLMKR